MTERERIIADVGVHPEQPIPHLALTIIGIDKWYLLTCSCAPLELMAASIVAAEGMGAVAVIRSDRPHPSQGGVSIEVDLAPFIAQPSGDTVH